MTMNDTVKVAPYCIVCRHSSIIKWHKHVFCHGHQKAAQQFLQHQINRLQVLLCNTVTSKLSDSWRCVFCDLAVATVEALAHVASTLHRKQVDTFCRHYRCDVKRQMRAQLSLQAAQWRELEKRRSTGKMANNHVEKQEKVEERVTTSERVEAFLSSAATRLQQVEKMNSRMGEDIPVVTVTREQQEALLGPHLALGKRCKTILSSEGILQNPLGRHEGKRVWGGGIVKLRMNQWIPWAIDQLVKEEQADKLDMQETGVEGITFTHRVTDIAQGDGLTSIMPVSWVANVRNVHTAAVPPWMVQTEEEYKKCNYRMPVVSSVSPARLTSKADKTRRDIFSELQSKSVCGQDWLPNFGGVWQEGPRSKTKQAFRKAVNAVKPTRDCDRDSRSKFHPSQLQGATPLPQVSPIDSQEPQPPAAVQDSVPEQKQATMRLSPPESRESRDNESQMKNMFDAKKQLLLAQKERLRAKMAVRRRQ